ncbi:hypothetical protein [Marinobacter sp. Hex_13]|uniref:hypothetical protein n=1 Tax=Marinobacter sp. Hex_13 TaxID=1795866 RepID=UPI00257AB61E|nr:hypothetical protein [Marinobacter sp. Hex_13]
MSEADKIRAAHEKYERIRAPRVFPCAPKQAGYGAADTALDQLSNNILGSNDDRKP